MPRTLIVAARKSKNLSQSALATLIQAKASQVSRIELGYGDPSPEEAAALCRVLGLQAADLNVGLPRANSVASAPQKSAPPAPQVAPAAGLFKTGEGIAKILHTEPAMVSIPRVGNGMQTESPASTKTEAPRGMAASARLAGTANSQANSQAVPGVTPSSNVADFTKEPDLSTPASFLLVPDESVLQLAGQHPDQARRRIGQAITYANRILHTSRIPAGIWLRWNQFSKLAALKLRDLPQV